MKKYRINILIVSIVAIVIAVSPFILGSSPVPEPESAAAKDDPYNIYSPHVPKHLTFAGKKIDLTRYDLRERMDRELTTFTYMHSTTLLMIKRANRYFPIVEPILKEYNIPEDFKYLMVIESNLNTLARSPVGAAGLWQFMEATGREYGLEVNKNIDERYHIEKATQAACKYLKDGYDKYGDWMTVAAAYNAGFRRISNSLSQQEAQTAFDLWLNEETSRYMFRILAAKTVFSDPADYGFRLKKENLYPVIPHEKVTITTGIADLARFALQKGITYAQLKDANPWLRDRSLENKTGRTYTLYIPTQEGMNYNPSKTVVHDKGWVGK